MAVQLIRRYNSIGDFLAVAETTPRDGSSTGTDRGDWYGTDTLDEAIKYARQGGWVPQVSTRFTGLLNEYLPRLRKYKSDELEQVADVCGGDVNMQAFLDGEPDCMFEWAPVESDAPKRALCLLVGQSASSGMTAEEQLMKGQAVVALVRALNLLGYELEIWSENTVEQQGRGTDQYTTLTRLHAAGEVLDIGAVEFALGCPAWQRRLVFAHRETESDSVRNKFGFTAYGGYGASRPPAHADDVNADLVLDLGGSWGLGYGSDVDKAEAGFEWIMRQLRAAGVVGEGE